ncbi:MAG: sigma-70 family RNA polymerase sigma factor [Solirubrobacteraceae bacterium]
MASRFDPVKRPTVRTGGGASWAIDPDAFEAFYREHVDAVERFVARRVGDRDLAADLTADVFVAAIESAGTYRAARGAPVAWLFGIARLVVASRLRREGRERRATARVRGRELLDVDDASRMNDRLAAEEQTRRLYAAMDQLPDGERAVLELAVLDDLPLVEVASALGIRPVTARVRFHRARRRLADQLTGPAADDFSPLSWQAKETSS